VGHVADTSVFPRSKFDAAATVERTNKTDGAIWTEYIFRAAPVALLVALGYYAATEAGFALTPTISPISALWPPNALLLAALLLVRRRFWWMLLLAVLPAHLIVQLHTGVPLLTALGWFVGNTGEALLGALCITYFRKHAPLFDSIRGVTVFLVFGVLLAPFVTSFLDAGVVLGTGWGSHFWMLWVRRLFSNMLAALTVAPAVILKSTQGVEWIRKAGPRQYLEGALLLLGIVLASFLAFGGETGWRSNTPALAFVPLPFLLWACMRLGSGALHGSLLIVALIATWNTIHGRDPFSSGSIQGNILSVQILLCAFAVPLMLLSAFMTELRQSTAKVIAAQEEERRHLARELHDDVCQRLTLVQLELEELEEESGSALQPRLERLHDQVSGIFKTTHEVSHGLHPSFLEHVGLAAALRTLCQDLRQKTSLHVRFSDEGLEPDLLPSVSLCLYRVAQAALENVVKHGHAQIVAVQLTADRRQVLLRIVDDGVGFVSNRPTTGLGLTSMRERVKSTGGKLEVESAPMEGTIIEASVPLERAKAATAG
jgi:signal transduction histidine kinase